MTVRLEELLAAATPRPWGTWGDLGPNCLRAYADGGYTRLALFDEWDGLDVHADENAQLAALAPDAVRLLIDMGEALARTLPDDEKWDNQADIETRALLARLDRLGNTT